jgi:hypothetical protein
MLRTQVNTTCHQKQSIFWIISTLIPNKLTALMLNKKEQVSIKINEIIVP